jgi:hypothetical protein
MEFSDSQEPQRRRCQMALKYQETKKLNEFVGRIYAAGDMVTKNNPRDTRRWPKDQTDSLRSLVEIGTDILNGFDLDESCFDGMEAGQC